MNNVIELVLDRDDLVTMSQCNQIMDNNAGDYLLHNAARTAAQHIFLYHRSMGTWDQARIATSALQGRVNQFNAGTLPV